ncbi:hypothetical protein AB0B78_18305 [Streptomyces sp. NPDC040724]
MEREGVTVMVTMWYDQNGRRCDVHAILPFAELPDGAAAFHVVALF